MLVETGFRKSEGRVSNELQARQKKKIASRRDVLLAREIAVTRARTHDTTVERGAAYFFSPMLVKLEELFTPSRK